MKYRSIILFVSLAALVGMAACKSSEANYRAAYDVTKARQLEMKGVDEATYARIEAERTANTAVIDGDSVRMVTNRVNMVDGAQAGVKPYGVVVGEYKQLFNARSFRDRLKKEGHDSYVVKDSDSNHYVIVEGFDTPQEAAAFLKEIGTRVKMRIPIEKPWILAQPKKH